MNAADWILAAIAVISVALFTTIVIELWVQRRHEEMWKEKMRAQLERVCVCGHAAQEHDPLGCWRCPMQEKYCHQFQASGAARVRR